MKEKENQRKNGVSEQTYSESDKEKNYKNLKTVCERW